MGCDIHMIVQVRDGESWRTVEVPNLDYKKDSKYSFQREEVRYRGYSDRNYDAFAILANVRNGTGVAGCDTGDGFEPIAEPRGFPKDFALDSEDDHCGVWMGDHSHSWLTLAELEACDWTRTTKQRGWVNGVELKRMRDAGEDRPKSWCGGVSGGRTKHVTLQELDRRIQQPVKNDLEYTYAVFEWEETYSEAAGRFYSDFLPILRTLGEGEDVRIVFGFDS